MKSTVKYTCTIEQFAEQGEKTGWTYIRVPSKLALQLKPGNKKSFRVKGKLDEYEFSGMALLPMGEGDFIMALNATVRKKIRKRKGDKLQVQLQEDTRPILPQPELIECLSDEPKALEYFNGLVTSHRTYFIKWIDAAKSDPTKTKRIAMVVTAMTKRQDFGEMLRSNKKNAL